MQRRDRYLSPCQLARALGVGESTVKRWIDQRKIPAEKTPGGHRRIPLCEALKLLRSGHLPGADPLALGFDAGDDASPDTLANVLCSDLPERALPLLENLYASGLGAGDLVDRWIAPAMHRIGSGWQSGGVSVTGEHRATSVMVGALHALLAAQPPAKGEGPRAFVAGLSRDPYLLAPLCAQLVLCEAGFETTNFGPDTPADDLAAAVRERRPALVALSFSISGATSRRGYTALSAACREAGSALVVGGRALRPDLVDDLGATVWCRSMTELDRMARHLAVLPSSQALAHAG